jgi:hypothetical protein
LGPVHRQEAPRPEAVMNANLNMRSINDRLDNFQLKTEGKTGHELFEHMCRRTTKNEYHKISDHLKQCLASRTASKSIDEEIISGYA